LPASRRVAAADEGPRDVTANAAHDLVTLGEVMLRLAIPAPARFETVRQLDVQIGGAEANVAAACARLGLRAAWISALPDNEWGDRIRRELESHRVDCGYVRRVANGRLGVYFVEYGVPPRPIRVVYDRRDSAFAHLGPDDVDWHPVRRARLVHVSGVTPALGDAPRALVRRAVGEAATLSFDVNYRAKLWSPPEARAFVDEVLPSVRYLFLGETEARLVFGLTGAAEAILESVARLAPKATVTMMRGREGSLTFDGNRFLSPTHRPTVEVVDPIGAGDAWVAGFLWATLSGRPLEAAIDAGSAVAALKCSIWGDIALVNVRDVEEVLAGGPDVRR
jgi:2-dehydro-3-deoxygluconokinase